jgi:ribosomal protein L7/L12
MPGLSPDQVQQIHEYIHNQQLIHAIKLYREATGVGLAEAKSAVEDMARGEAVKPPSGVVDYDNPILDAKLKSLLSRGQKIDAIKIYREEYGVGLKEAKDVVDRIEMSMKRSGSSMIMPYESAIGSDPFTERPGGSRVILLVAAVSILLCGIGVFLLMMNFQP